MAEVGGMMTPQEFIAAISPAARTSMAKTKIPASFTIAEGALESGWGVHAPGMNLFGVKADASWHGPVTTLRTREVVHGQSVIEVAKFRAYDAWLGSIQDHAAFLLNNPRYKPAFAHAGDAEAFTHVIAAAGYATDPRYAEEIIGLMHTHDLAQFDTGVVPA